MSARQEQNTGTRGDRESHRFDERNLEDYLSSHNEGYHGPVTVSELFGGQSNPTYFL